MIITQQILSAYYVFMIGGIGGKGGSVIVVAEEGNKKFCL